MIDFWVTYLHIGWAGPDPTRPDQYMRVLVVLYTGVQEN